jgi:hypothetical protein
MKSLLVSLAIILMLCAGVGSAAQRGRGLTGDWDMKLNFDGGEMASILSFAKDTEGKLSAQWITIMGIGKANNITHEGKDIRFTLTGRFGDQDYTSDFVGTLQKGSLSGRLTNDQSEITTEGKKLKRMPLIVGTWNMTITMGEREFETVLVVRSDKQNQLKAEWQSQWGEHSISDVQFKAGKLTFSRVSTFEERKWETTYEGTLKAHALTGAFTSEQGKLPANGKRVGALLVGKWDLTMESYQGTSKQRLTVLPDLSARFGSMPITKIGLEEGRVDFKLVLPFDGNEYEIGFTGELKARKLTGKLTTAQGTSDVIGTKIRIVRKKK